ncbi:NAD(P)-dependent oxidoreductase [Phycicoccus ginsengisoli]
MTSTPTVAVLGTGIMGAGMARSLRRADLPVRVWNRSRDKAEPLTDAGATVYASAAEAVTGADVVVTMLYDHEAVRSTLEQCADAFGADTVWVQASTVGVAGTEALSSLAMQRGIAFLDAPVLGTRDPAEKGALVLLVSGDRSLAERVQPVLDAVGSRTMWVGDEPGAASRLKLAVNSWVATINAGVGQALALAEGLGVDPRLFLEAIGGGPTDTPYAQLKGGLVLERAYAPAFAVDNVSKDVGLMVEAASAAGVDTGVLEALAAAYARASAQGHGGDDMAAVAEAFRTRRGERPE